MSNKYPFGLSYQKAVIELGICHGAKNSKLGVLRAIVACCNSATGTCYPGNKKIMYDANITSKETLNNALRWLKDRGIIKAVSHEGGGHGCAVTWGFALSPGSTPEDVRTSLENGELNIANNLPKNSKLPPQKFEVTSPVSREPRNRKDLKENEATPSRREVDKVPSSDPSPDDTDALTPVKPWEAISVLSRHGIKASVSEVTAGVYTRQLEECGHVVG